MCEYCGLPFVSSPAVMIAVEPVYPFLHGADIRIYQANEHHRKHLESLPSTSYPLEPLGDPAEVPESQRITDEVLGQR